MYREQQNQEKPKKSDHSTTPKVKEEMSSLKSTDVLFDDIEDSNGLDLTNVISNLDQSSLTELSVNDVIQATSDTETHTNGTGLLMEQAEASNDGSLDALIPGPEEMVSQPIGVFPAM